MSDGPWQLPKTLVLSAETYQFCLACVVDELWHVEHAELRFEQARDELRQHSLEQIVQGRRAIRRALGLAVHKRRAAMAQQPSAVQQTAIAIVWNARSHGEELRWLRVSARRLMTWFCGTAHSVRGAHEGAELLIRDLAWTDCYSQWLAAGGDANVGRYLGQYGLRFYKGVEPSG